MKGLKHNGALLFNSVKIAETSNFFFTNIGSNIAKRIAKGKKFAYDISKR